MTWDLFIAEWHAVGSQFQAHCWHERRRVQWNAYLERALAPLRGAK